MPNFGVNQFSRTVHKIIIARIENSSSMPLICPYFPSSSLIIIIVSVSEWRINANGTIFFIDFVHDNNN